MAIKKEPFMGERHSDFIEDELNLLSVIGEVGEKVLKVNVVFDQGCYPVVEVTKVCSDDMIRVLRKVSWHPDIMASEYLFAFVAWLTGRPEVLTIGASEDCSVWARVVDTFCKENNLAMPRNNYAESIVYPKEIK